MAQRLNQDYIPNMVNPNHNLRACVEVVAGVIPEQPMVEFTRRFPISADDWHAAEGEEQVDILNRVQGPALLYAHYLMLQPDRVNWVRTEWIWF